MLSYLARIRLSTRILTWLADVGARGRDQSAGGSSRF
jgi:hypothetical protein